MAIIQDWAAVWELKKARKIPDDAVFVPGHTGDFICGGHIPQSFASMQNVGKDEVVKAIWKKHYSLWDWSGQSGKLGPIFKERVLSELSEMPLMPLNAGSGRNGRQSLSSTVIAYMNFGDMIGGYRFGIVR